MSKAKPVEAEKPLFQLIHADKARETVFEQKRSIMFQASMRHIKATIEIRPDKDGGATLKCRVWPIYSTICKTTTVACADADDLEWSFDEASRKTIAMMQSMAKGKRKPIK